jgi:hypothetical protein
MRSTVRLALVILGGILTATGLIISYTAVGGFQEDLQIEAHSPYDPVALFSNYEEYLWYVKWDYENLNRDYFDYRNFTLGMLSPGSTIRLTFVEVFPEDTGYRWTREGYLEEFHPDEGECNASAGVWPYENGKWMGIYLGADQIVMGERVEREHYETEYEVEHEGMQYMLRLGGSGSRPFGASAKCTVVTLYGRAAPYLVIGGIVLILTTLLEPLARSVLFRGSAKEKDVPS